MLEIKITGLDGLVEAINNLAKAKARELVIEAEAPKTEAPKTEYTLEQVRAKAVELQRAGKRELVKEVITATGAKKLTEVDQSKYDYMMKCFKEEVVLSF